MGRCRSHCARRKGRFSLCWRKKHPQRCPLSQIYKPIPSICIKPTKLPSACLGGPIQGSGGPVYVPGRPRRSSSSDSSPERPGGHSKYYSSDDEHSCKPIPTYKPCQQTGGADSEDSDGLEEYGDPGKVPVESEDDSDLSSDSEDEIPKPPVVQSKPPPKPPAQFASELQVSSVDLKISQNCKKHHTQEYDITEGPEAQLVVRRGQEFFIQVTFSRPVNLDTDNIQLLFQTGGEPRTAVGTQVFIKVSDKETKGYNWSAQVVKQQKETIVISVLPPASCCVSIWYLWVDVTVPKCGQKPATVLRYKHKTFIYILFNPWCKEDAVYLKNHAERDEYVLNDKGNIYMGNIQQVTTKPWIFGQFSGKVLDSVLYLQGVRHMQHRLRGNPIEVVRYFASMINLNTKGVLVGNWSGKYDGGKSPLTWTGSPAILEQYYAQKQPVKFGQCWVIAGVLTTVCRALGIPARCVTNYISAHDADGNSTINVHVDQHGNQLEHLNEDSVWGFHVWNEVWMTRPDLQAGYGGWQVVDATPQEGGQGALVSGPCPVLAIKEKNSTLGCDAAAIIAEVNVNRVYWMCKPTGETIKVFQENDCGGKLILTDHSSQGKVDLTLSYKPPKGKDEEKPKDQHGQPIKVPVQTSPTGVTSSLSYDANSTFVGNDVVITITCVNISSQEQQKETVITVVAKEYQSLLKDCCLLGIMASVMHGKGQACAIFKELIRLRKPHLAVKGPKQGKVGEEFTLRVSFQNPFQTTLTECYLEAEAPGITGSKKYPVSDIVKNGQMSTEIKLKPVKAGMKPIVIIFNCKQLEDINSSHNIVITAESSTSIQQLKV